MSRTTGNAASWMRITRGCAGTVPTLDLPAAFGPSGRVAWIRRDADGVEYVVVAHVGVK